MKSILILQGPSILFSERILNLVHLPGGTVMDIPMILITWIGTTPAYITFFFLIYHCIDRHRGTVMTWLYLMSSATNGILKGLFGTPRPDPSLLVHGDLARQFMPASTSFPSGHAQGAVVFFGTLMILFPRRATRIGGIVMILLVSYSRLYLGVHFPGDIAGGWLPGCIILCLTVPALALEKNAGRNSDHGRGLFITILLLAPAVFFPSDHVRALSGFLAGFTAGIFHAPRVPAAVSAKKLILSAGIMVLTLLPSLPAMGSLFLFFTMWMTGFWMSSGYDIIAGRRPRDA